MRTPALPSPPSGNLPLPVTDKGMYLLTVVWMDHLSDDSLELGAVSHETCAAQQKSWRAFPAATDKTTFFLQMRDTAQSLLASKPVSAEAVEALLGEPVATLLARGRSNTLSTISKLKSKLKLGKHHE
jgi:hypothetical protein